MGQSGATEIDATCSVCQKEGNGTYRTEAECLNCGWKGTAVHSITHEKGDQTEDCPRCGCQRIYMGAFLDD
jgi:predicted Zn-ribbon and HTH transcriptional regulator